jgi:protein O-mannosyl-transferase
MNNLAWIRATAAETEFRNGTEAVRLAEHACKLTQYREPVLVGTLAAAYAEIGNFDDAVGTAEMAHELAVETGQAELAEKNLKLMELYKARKPFREDT